jgi:SNF2 family DNA or RNA helicase
LATLPELKREAAVEGKNHSTLIVLPPVLVSQWQNEIVKATGDALVVDYLDYKTGRVTRRGSTSGDADIVLTTYKALEQPSVAKILNQERWGRIVLVRARWYWFCVLVMMLVILTVCFCL